MNGVAPKISWVHTALPAHHTRLATPSNTRLSFSFVFVPEFLNENIV